MILNKKFKAAVCAIGAELVFFTFIAPVIPAFAIVAGKGFVGAHMRANNCVHARYSWEFETRKKTFECLEYKIAPQPGGPA